MVLYGMKITLTPDTRSLYCREGFGNEENIVNVIEMTRNYFGNTSRKF
jgi:hypothetical protein